jgi:hypothetical protein
MPTIIAYRKYIDPEITRELLLPTDDQLQPLGTELATLADGTTYVCLPDGAALPTTQPQEIAASIAQGVTLTAALIADIKAASPHVRLINQRVADQIAAEYSLAEEIKLLRTAPSIEFETYNAHAESCRAWGRAEKAKLGLV